MDFKKWGYKRYHTLDSFYKEKFKSKVAKISLNGGFTCPNIDGFVGYGGCIYCSSLGSGDFAGKKTDTLTKQFNDIKELIDRKWPNSKYIGYLQANTNTYAPLPILKEKYEEILVQDNVIGLSIATRPDCISDEVIDYLENLSKRTYLTIELGLQTIHEKTSLLINRCHTLECFVDAVTRLRKRNINVVVHIINGLPYETKEMMIETVKFLNKFDIQGIKIHMLHIIKNTRLAKIYEENPFKILTKDEYIDIVCDQLEYLRDDIIINRITGDPDSNNLIEPTWLTKKFCIINDIDKELTRRNTYQGYKISKDNLIIKIIDKIIKENDYVIDLTNHENVLEKYVKKDNIKNKLDNNLECKTTLILTYDSDIEKYAKHLHNRGFILVLDSKEDIKYEHTIYNMDEYYIAKIDKQMIK